MIKIIFCQFILVYHKMAFQSKHEVLLGVKYKLKEQYPNTSLINNMPARVLSMWAIRSGKFYF